MRNCTTCGGSRKIRFQTSCGLSNPEDCYSCIGTGKSSDRITNTDVSNGRKKMFDIAKEERNKRYLNED